MNENQKNIVFMGTLEECLDHLYRCMKSNLQKVSKIVEARQPIADFCNVTSITVKNWLDGGNVVGQSKIRLMCFMDMCGYCVTDFEEFKHTKLIVEMLGYGVISFDNIQKILNYNSIQHLLSILMAKDGIHQIRQDTLWKTVNEKKQELVVKKEDCRQRFQLTFPLTEALRHRKNLAIISLAETFLTLLETPEVGNPFMESLSTFGGEEINVVLSLAEKLEQISKKLVKLQKVE